MDSPARLPDQDVNGAVEYELLICAAHFIGDGMALHQFANDLFGMLGGTSSQEELDQLVSNEWKQHWGQIPTSDVRFHPYCDILRWPKMVIEPRSSSESRGKPRDGTESVPTRGWTC